MFALWVIYIVANLAAWGGLLAGLAIKNAYLALVALL